MEHMYVITKKLNKIINVCLYIILIIVLLFTSYVLWDAWALSNGSQYGDGDRADELARLHNINSDVIGWLVLDDTSIDYPLLIGETNSDYLNKNAYGEYALSGSLFLDYRNKEDFSDFSTIIYGHNMSNSGMLADLLHYKKESYFDSHLTGTLYTLEGEKELEVYAIVETDAYDKVLYRTQYDNEESKQKYINYIKSENTFINDLNIKFDDQMIVLSTCDFSVTKGRVLLIVKIV